MRIVSGFIASIHCFDSWIRSTDSIHGFDGFGSLHCFRTFVVPRLWSMVSGLWSLVHGLWSLVSGQRLKDRSYSCSEFRIADLHLRVRDDGF